MNEMEKKMTKGQIPFDAYAMLYVAQSLYQVGGERWKEYYPKIREAIVKMQSTEAGVTPASSTPARTQDGDN